MEKYFSFACSQRGQSHVENNTVCQDSSDSFDGEKYTVIVVSDGHGSENFTRSDRGSKYACQAAIEAIEEFYADYDFYALKNDYYREKVVSQLCKNILLRWNKKVDEDIAKWDFSEEEVKNVSEKYKNAYLEGRRQEHAYGATLLVAIQTKHFFLALRNGDGECVTVNRKGKFSTPVPENENCEANYTTSLCDSDAISDFRYFMSFEEDESFPLAVFLASDGVDNSYTNEEEMFALYRNICRIAISKGYGNTVEEVQNALAILTTKGSGDDVSIAGIVNEEGIAQIASILEKDAEARRTELLEQREKAAQAETQKKEKQTIKARDHQVVEDKTEILKKLEELFHMQSVRVENLEKLDDIIEMNSASQKRKKVMAKEISEYEEQKSRLMKMYLDTWKEADDLIVDYSLLENANRKNLDKIRQFKMWFLNRGYPAGKTMETLIPTLFKEDELIKSVKKRKDDRKKTTGLSESDKLSPK